MTLQHVFDDWMLWPGTARRFSNNSGIGSRTTLDAAGEYHAVCMMAQEDMVVSHVYFKPNAVSGSPTIDIRIETVDATTGLPTGTLWATDTNIITGALTTSGVLHALTASATIPRGSWYAVKFLYNSGTSLATSELFPNSTTQELAFAYSAVNTGAPTKGTLLTMIMGLASSTTAFYQLPGTNWPLAGGSNSNINNTDGARWGARFKVPFACEIHGALVASGVDTPYDITFYSDAGSAISGATGSNVTGPTVGFSNPVRTAVLIGTPFSPTPGTWYRGAVVPTSSTNFGQRSLGVTSVDYLSALPGRGNHRRTDYTTAGGWSDTNEAQLPLFDLLIRRLSDGASAGGGRQKVYSG